MSNNTLGKLLGYTNFSNPTNNILGNLLGYIDANNDVNVSKITNIYGPNYFVNNVVPSGLWSLRYDTKNIIINTSYNDFMNINTTHNIVKSINKINPMMIKHYYSQNLNKL